MNAQADSGAGSKTTENELPTKTPKKPTKQCGFCGLQTKHLRNHIKNQHYDQAFKCEDCSYYSDNRCRYKQHLLSKGHLKMESNKIMCPQCKLPCKDRINLNLHTKNEHPELIYQCPKCDYFTRIMHNIKKHYKCTHNEEMPNCPGCSQVFFNSALLEEHKNNCLSFNKKYTCRLCSYSSNKKSKVGEHIVNSHCQGISCVFCAFITDKSETLRQHIIERHVFNNKDINTVDSLAADSNLSHLIGNMNIIEQSESFHCSYCSFVTDSKTKLKRHKNEHYTKCDYCDFRTQQNASMLQHLKDKHSCVDKFFSCNFCTFVCEDYDDFLEHLDVKHNHFICCYTNCRFQSQNIIFLAQHITDYHGWNKSGYNCSYCGHVFEYSFSMGQHKRDKHNIKLLFNLIPKSPDQHELDNIFITS